MTKLKLFLTYTAIIEAFTGISLLIIPSHIVSLLLNVKLEGDGSIVVTMIAGVAILSLAILCWLFRDRAGARPVVFTLLFYNVLITAVFIYGMLRYSFSGPGLLVVICFHFFQTIVSVVLILNKTEKNFNQIN